jgi:SAM-dependent methyltransferase
MATATVDAHALEIKVKEMYRAVAADPRGPFHFELGRELALRLGYDERRLEMVPAPAVDSFAGVGHFFDLLALTPGETVLDLGSGSGMDVFYAAGLVGPTGMAMGVEFTPEQLAKAGSLMMEQRIGNVDLREGAIEALPVESSSVDAVISNGVINLCPDKRAVFAEVARVLRPGGRLAVADIVSEHQLSDAIVCDADLWASCIGGAAQQDLYLGAIEAAGLTIVVHRMNPYEFISDQARNASVEYGVKSISLLATKPAH